ncbi:hypothetical protein K2X05_13160 [bacterium]|nr:hypothetical protein [bacterium]
MSKKNLLFYLFLALCPALLFQNCGQDYSTNSLYENNPDMLYSQDCISEVVDCGAKSEFLLVSIDTQDPLVITVTGIAPPVTSYKISGRCNTGNYPEHAINYEVRNAIGNRVSMQTLAGICIQGLYQFDLPIATLRNNESHSLIVTMTGIDDQGRAFTNAQSGGNARIDFFKQ